MASTNVGFEIVLRECDVCLVNRNFMIEEPQINLKYVMCSSNYMPVEIRKL